MQENRKRLNKIYKFSDNFRNGVAAFWFCVAGVRLCCLIFQLVFCVATNEVEINEIKEAWFLFAEASFLFAEALFLFAVAWFPFAEASFLFAEASF